MYVSKLYNILLTYRTNVIWTKLTFLQLLTFIDSYLTLWLYRKKEQKKDFYFYVSYLSSFFSMVMSKSIVQNFQKFELVDFLKIHFCASADKISLTWDISKSKNILRFQIFLIRLIKYKALQFKIDVVIFPCTSDFWK